MIYIPVIGFIYAAVRMHWALWMVDHHLMTIADEMPYFEQFVGALPISAGFVLLCMVYCQTHIAILRKRLARSH